MSKDVFNAIFQLKKEKNAVLLVHNYQDNVIQEIGDFVGDSLELAQKATNIEKDLIVFAGAEFMAETAAILNPNKKVIIPSSMAKCPMAHMLTPKMIDEYKEKHPEAAVALYINTTAETKAMVDVCITSGNAVRIIRGLDEKEILVGPDINLAYFIQNKIPEKKIIPIPEKGHCYVHRKFTIKDVNALKKEYPNAKLLVHPETEPGIQKMANKILSTSGMISYVNNNMDEQFLIATEIGLIDRLRRDHPKMEIIPVRKDAICVQQKKITLYNLYLSLLKEQYEIKIPESLIKQAYLPIRRMLDLSK